MPKWCRSYKTWTWGENIIHLVPKCDRTSSSTSSSSVILIFNMSTLTLYTCVHALKKSKQKKAKKLCLKEGSDLSSAVGSGGRTEKKIKDKEHIPVCTPACVICLSWCIFKLFDGVSLTKGFQLSVTLLIHSQISYVTPSKLKLKICYASKLCYLFR